MVQSVRNSLKDPAHARMAHKRVSLDELERLGGWDEIDDPWVGEKIRRVLAQGHIDREEFLGDPR